MKVKFLPSEEEHEIEFNETILHLANRAGLHIQSVCKGIPSCAECRIQIKDGEHHVLPPSKKELDLIGTAHYVDRSRLACQLRCFGDVTVDLTEQISKEKRAQEKPRDRMARSDGQDSKAVLGGILDNVVAEDVELEKELEAKVEKVKVESFKGDPNLDRRDSFYGSFYTGEKKKAGNNNKKKKHKSKGRSGDKKRSQSAQGGKKQESSEKPTGSKKKSRNRNRNRNRRRSASESSKS